MDNYKVQWVDANGLHLIRNNKYETLLTVARALRNSGIDCEFWDMTGNIPVRIL